MQKATRKRKTNIPRTKNAGSMTESMFWSFIRSSLRQKSRWWKPIDICRKNARRQYKGVNRRQKWEYQCNNCKNWFIESQTSVDHIIPAGQLRCADDLPGFVERLFCEVEGLQLLCDDCHSVKTQNEKNER
jgi:5-methylcytosine-specific restriction endonuclease McrA